MAEEATNTELGTMEDRASRMGWTPKEEFRGAPERWVDAETYVRNAENVMPHLKGTLNTLEKRTAAQEKVIKDLNDKLTEIRGDMSEFVSFSKQAEERAYNKALKEMQARQRQAVLDSDVETYDKVTADLDEHIAQHPAVTGKPLSKVDDKPKASDPVAAWQDPDAVATWTAENKWYYDKPKMAAYADSMDRWLNSKYGLTKTHAERLAEITELVKEEFPDYFNPSNPKKASAPGVGSSEGGTPADAGKQSYANLPPEAKAQCDKWAGKDGKGTGTMGEGFTREDYLKSYRW